MKKAILTVGIPGIGKSTFFKNLGDDWKQMERDIERVTISKQLYPELFNDYNPEVHNFHHDFYYKQSKNVINHIENMVNKKYDDFISDKSISDVKIVFSDTNITQKYRENLFNKLTSNGFDVELKVFPADLEKALKQNQYRKNVVPEHVIFNMWQKQVTQFPESMVLNSDKKKNVVICDLDGTIAHSDNKRGWYEYKKVEQDRFDDFIFNLVHSAMMFYDAKLYFVTGREDYCYSETLSWLKKSIEDYNLEYGKDYELLMRKNSDHRCDTIVKKEIYDVFIKPLYDTKVVFDDRKKVVDMWNDLGLRCIAVSDQRNEF